MYKIVCFIFFTEKAKLRFTYLSRSDRDRAKVLDWILASVSLWQKNYLHMMLFFKRISAKKAVVIMELYKSNGLLKCSTARIMI